MERVDRNGSLFSSRPRKNYPFARGGWGLLCAGRVNHQQTFPLNSSDNLASTLWPVLVQDVLPNLVLDGDHSGSSFSHPFPLPSVPWAAGAQQPVLTLLPLMLLRPALPPLPLSSLPPGAQRWLPPTVPASLPALPIGDSLVLQLAVPLCS